MTIGGPGDPSGATTAKDEGGTSGGHPDLADHVSVAPNATEESDKFNSLRAALTTSACWRLDDIRFEFDSSFILPAAELEFQRLAELSEAYPKHLASIFGHADPVGQDDYNKKLSGRRAQSAYAVVTRKTELWEDLYQNAHGGDKWSLANLQQILQALGFFAGPNDGKNTPETQRAVRNFQESAGLGVDGIAGPNTRKELFTQYMDFLCHDAQDNLFRLEPERFLGKGADSKGKADFQGCGEFNPVLLLSQKQVDGFAKSKDEKARNAANAPNRRVVLFFFRPGLGLVPEEWPCPRASEGSAGCKKRFWSDAEERRKPAAEEDRKYEETRNTFACRFYDRLARRSPCEAGVIEWVLRIRSSGPRPLADRDPVANATFTVEGPSVPGGKTQGTTDADGIARFRATANAGVMTLKVAGVVITLNGGALVDFDDDEPLAVQQRLYNLGYGPPEREPPWLDEVRAEALKSFQTDHELDATGALDDASRDKLREIHGS